ncbi:MAG: T9SS type A sorting domain-containing protein, partial [Flavobacteriales bacterium]
EAEGNCRSMDWTGASSDGALDMSPGVILNIFGSLILAQDVVYDFTLVEFEGNNDSNVVTSNGASMGIGQTRFLGTGLWTLTDDLVGGSIQLWTGTLNTGGNDITLDGNFTMNGAASKSLVLNDSRLQCAQWRFFDDNLNLNAGTSTIVCSQFYGSSDQVHTYYNVEFINESIVLAGGGNFNNIDISETAGGYLRFDSGLTYTINEFIGTSTRLAPFKFYTTTPGEEATINKTSGSVSFDYAVIQDIHATGGANFSISNAVDLGNNDGWNLTDLVPWDYYWVNNAGDWDDVSHWSDVSGGIPAYDFQPTQFDNVYFDENSFSIGSQVIGIDEAVYMNELDMSAVTNSPTLQAPYGTGMNVYGNMFIPNDVNKLVHRFDFWSSTPVTIHPGSTGAHYTGLHNGGVFTFQGDFNVSAFDISDASFILDGGDMVSNYNFTAYSQADLVDLTSGTLECRDFIFHSPNTDFEPGTSTITVRGNFRGGDRDYYHVVLTEESTLQGNNSYEILEVAPGSLAQIEAGTTHTVNGEIMFNGTPDAPISIGSMEAGLQATIAKASGTVNAQYVILQDNNATGGATFNALQALDNGNNTGWNVTELQPNDYFWVGGAGDWSDVANHWATTSGGNTFYEFPPSVLDNVYFDENSFSGTNEQVNCLAEINFHDMDWTGATGTPYLVMNQNAMNVYGTITTIENMTTSIKDVFLLSNEAEVISTPHDGGLGTNAYVYIENGGDFSASSDFTCRELHLTDGSYISNGNDLWVDFHVYLGGQGEKIFDVQNSYCYFRSLSWNDGAGQNLTMNAQGSEIQFSGTFSPYNYNDDLNIDVTLNDLRCESEGFLDGGSINSSIEVNVLTIAAGKTLDFYNTTTVTVNQLICEGTAELPITFEGSADGTQCTISQASGTVYGEYLVLKDISAVGGAEFFANNSLDNGNVSGWIFTGQAQSINFDSQDDVMEDVGSITLNASATSGLPVTYALVSGPAVVNGDQVNITGPGRVIIEANQDGDDTYNPAPVSTIEFCSIPFQPTISIQWEPGSVILTSSSSQGNQWFDADGILNGADDVTYETFVDGSYYVHVDVDGCVSEISEPFVALIDNVIEFSQDNVSLYPNPADGEFLITHDQVGADLDVTIFSANGQLMNKFQLNASVLSVDCSAFAMGVYFVHIQKENEVVVKRLVIR